MDDKVTIDLDRETFDALSRRAESHGWSVGQEVNAIVRDTIAPPAKANVDYVAWSRRIRAMTPKGVMQTDSLTLLREDRDR